MTDVSVCQTEGFQAVWRFLRLFRTTVLQAVKFCQRLINNASVCQVPFGKTLQYFKLSCIYVNFCRDIILFIPLFKIFIIVISGKKVKASFSSEIKAQDMIVFCK
jgi:hypothetical protein